MEMYLLEYNLHEWGRFYRWARENNQSALERVYSVGVRFTSLLEAYRKLDSIDPLPRSLKEQKQYFLDQLHYTLIDMVSLYNETGGKEGLRIFLDIPEQGDIVL